MLDASIVLVEDDDIGDGLSMTGIVTHDALQFDTYTGASPESSDRGRAQAILPDFHGFPQHLPALVGENYMDITPGESAPAYCPRSLGSRVSRKASPRRLKARTVTEMARPGNTMSHQRGL